MSEFFRDYYVDFILKRHVKILVGAFFLIYLIVSCYGIATMKQGLDYEKLLLKSDPLVRTVAVEIELFHGGDQIEIAIVNAPNMIDPVNRAFVEQIIADFETIEYAMGAKGTQVWLREYIKYANQTGAFLRDDHASWVRGVHDWSQLFAYYKLWSQDFVWTNEFSSANEDKLKMQSFRFRIGVTEFHTASDLVRVTQQLREVAARYPAYNIITYQQSRAIADQLNVLLPNTMQNDALAMLCMILISLLFIPNPLCTFWIATAMVTIDIGVIGFLSLWSVKLDPISMITLVLAIGFSIEFSAHVTYGFVSNEYNLTPRQRCVDTMEKLAWPMVHGSLSTIAGVLVLAFINSYMVLVFFKTVFLVLVIGIFHALVFLPIVLHDTAPYTDRFRNTKVDSTTGPSSSSSLSASVSSTSSSRLSITDSAEFSSISSSSSPSADSSILKTVSEKKSNNVSATKSTTGTQIAFNIPKQSSIPTNSFNEKENPTKFKHSSARLEFLTTANKTRHSRDSGYESRNSVDFVKQLNKSNNYQLNSCEHNLDNSKNYSDKSSNNYADTGFDSAESTNNKLNSLDHRLNGMNRKYNLNVSTARHARRNYNILTSTASSCREIDIQRSRRARRRDEISAHSSDTSHVQSSRRAHCSIVFLGSLPRKASSNNERLADQFRNDYAQDKRGRRQTPT